MKKLKATLLIGAAATLAAFGLVAGANAKPSPAERPTVTMNAVWEFHPATLAQAQGRAMNILQVRIDSVRAGADIVTPAKGEPGAVDRIPTQRITATVVRSFKGTTKVGEQITLFQTGGVISTAVKGDTHPKLVIEGDPAYVAGEQYVLLLVPGPQGTQRIIAPEGRYRVATDGELSATVANPITDEVKAKGLRAFAS